MTHPHLHLLLFLFAEGARGGESRYGESPPTAPHYLLSRHHYRLRRHRRHRRRRRRHNFRAARIVFRLQPDRALAWPPPTHIPYLLLLLIRCFLA